MERDAVLYALSTLAQTCAALAAFVGAVGIFRLQILREQRKEEDQTRRLYVYATRGPGGEWTTPLGFGPVPGPADEIEQVIRDLERERPDHPAASATDVGKPPRGSSETVVRRSSSSRGGTCLSSARHWSGSTTSRC